MIAVSKHISNKYNKFILKCSIFVINIVINVSSMKFNFIESHRTTAEEQDEVLRRAPGKGDERGWRPLIRGCRHSDWGLRQRGFRRNP